MKAAIKKELVQFIYIQLQKQFGHVQIECCLFHTVCWKPTFAHRVNTKLIPKFAGSGNTSGVATGGQATGN